MNACPDCPVCGHPPTLAVGPTQVFCCNVDCRCVAWNPSLTQAQNVAGAQEVSLEALTGLDPS